MRTLQLDWETEQKRCVSYFNQIMELEKERDQVSVRGEGLARAWNYGSHSLPCPTQSVTILQLHLQQHANFSSLTFSSFYQALHSRDSLQLEYTDCLLDKNRLRKRIAELQANLEQQQRELERERERSREQREQSSPCLHCVS